MMKALGEVLADVFAELGIEAPGAAVERAHGVRLADAPMREETKRRPMAQQREEENRAPMGMGKKDADRTRPAPVRQEVKRQHGARIGGNPFPGCVADIVGIATSNGRVIRERPLLVIMDGGLA